MPRGETVTLKSTHGRANVTLNGALSWPAREVITREADKITGIEMIAFFDQIEARYPLARTITLIMDNATDNRAAVVRERLATPGCRIRVIYLPPYAPNLNLIERLWRFFKGETLSNKHYPSFADFKAAIRGFFANLDRWKDALASLITKKFHLIQAEHIQIPTA